MSETLYYLDTVILPEAGVRKFRGDVFSAEEARSSADSLIAGGAVGVLSAEDLEALKPKVVTSAHEGGVQKESDQPPVDNGAGGAVVTGDLLSRVKAALTGSKKRLKTLSEELGVPETDIEPLLTEANGVVFNASWYSLAGT